MAKYCREVQEWIEEEIEKPVDEWIEKRVKKCKKKKCKKWCLCCNKWFCWIETTFEKVVKWVVVTVGKWVTRTVCEVVHTTLDIIGLFLGLIFSIPLIGRLIKELWNLISEVANRILGVLDLILCIFGVSWTKKLRICIIILRDEKNTPTSTPEKLKPEIKKAQEIYRNAANIHLIVEGIYTVDNASPSSNLDVGCGFNGWIEDLGLVGSYYERVANSKCFDSNSQRLTGWAAPVIVFAVRSVTGTAAGCSLGPFSDYVTIEGANPECLAHEIGHACTLPHNSEKNNLMNPTCGGTKLNKLQKCILRNSRHVTFI
ncbi:MAG: hypothetical protein D6813_01125 [Calditrichaeota bacterium]|nr:MAG: hypothetical protein D6813_01125 [Calditrichota bacterium]